MGSASKEKYRKIMTIKLKLQTLDKWRRSRKSCLHEWFISWVVIYGYNIIKMTRVLILCLMHRFWFRVNIWWSKVGIMAVF